MPVESLSQFFPLASLAATSEDRYLYYSQPIEELGIPGISPFYRLHLAIWQIRPLDLQTLFPLDSVEGRLGFLNWCLGHGRKEYQALQELNAYWNVLAQPAQIPASEISQAITGLIVLGASARFGAHFKDSLASVQNQLKLMQWLCLEGWQALGFQSEDITEYQQKLFNARLENGFTFVQMMIHKAISEQQAFFDLAIPSGQLAYRNWLNQNGCEFTILKLFNRKQSQFGDTDGNYPKEKSSQSTFGVNLIGYAYGELGIGEDVRMAALALKAANVPFTVINFCPGGNVRQQDRSIEQWISDQAVYPINLVCLTALEHLRLFAERGEALFRHRYTIGYWPWELQKWPENWQHCFNLVNEVWVSSQHTWQALNNNDAVPVFTMPMAVVLNKVTIDHRKNWSLPDEDYLFVFSFDGNSTLARKNPLAIIQAFELAFPLGNEAVGLVIKCMRPDQNSPAWQNILKQAKLDPRIYIIDQMLEKDQVLGLYKLCNCFVSLHRAEGFGRGIAEALLLGLDVIATDYGGNVDFCLTENAHLVNSRMIDVQRDDYVEPSNQCWAEPDIHEASLLMRRVASTQATVSETDRQSIQSRFSVDTVGQRYKSRLEAIFEAANN